MQDESSDLQKMQNGIIFTVFNNITCVFVWFIDNWAITRFKQMKSYLKENYLTVKLRVKNTLDITIIIKNLRFNLDCIAYHHRNHMVESTNRFFVMHYTAGLILSVVFN
jgi:hypothetical protein